MYRKGYFFGRNSNKCTEKGISSEEIAINVQLYPISSEDIP